jgi:bifunctional non-homologous end joining protein LigD
MAKRADAPYRGGRGPDWLKIRADRTGDFVVVGFTEPQGSRAGLGALHVAWWENGGLVYAGRVGTGFTDRELTDLRAALDKDRRPGSNDPPCAGPLPAGAGHAWVTPRRVVEVRYKEWTQEGLLRQPAFLRFRDDKRMEECVREGAPHAAPETMAAESAPVPTAKPRREAAGAAEKNVAFSNQDKIFWPEEGYTKGDLIEYYRAISPWLLPYLRDRPVVLTRYPDGIAGKNFFQKDAPVFIPGWIRTHRVWSEQAQREIDYFICDDLESLLYVANMASIPLHMWSSRVKTLAQPDWCILDLDPKGAPFTDVVKVARSIKILCDRIGLPSFPKTSGSTGLHVLLPLGQQLTYEQSRTLATLLSNVIVQELPEIATVARSIGARGGRVYVDAFQNGHGRTIAGPFSARPVPGALVSMPLRWSEVNARLDPKKFTIKSGPARMKRLRKDPLLRVLELKPDLVRALSALEKRFSPAPAKKAPSKAR